MSDSLNKKWSEIFGEAWSRVAQLSPELGAYLLDHRAREVAFDRNSRLLLEADTLPDYDGMLDIIDALANQRKVFAMLTATAVYEDEGYTAGILRWHYDFSGTQAKEVLPIYDRAQFKGIASRCKTPSLLALLEFRISDDQSTINDGQLFGILAATISSAPDGSILCANHKNCFWLFVPNFSDDAEELLLKIQHAVINSGQAVAIGEKTADRYITFAAGIGAGDGTIEERMSNALFALYEANLCGEGSIRHYSSERYEISKEEYERMSRFLRLVNENLFQYHFQPIVSAKNGELVAYEMLMRTDPSIGMYPLEILDCADKAKRLYDIEKATIENALSIIEKHQDVFQKKKLFVNSITTHMLSDEDWDALASRYGELMEKMVIEFTEQSELDADRIDSVKNRLLNSHTKIAIDDFGTGYSNTMNLLRYSPDCVKIDRSLISGIDTKPTLRKLVSGVIEFIHENGYLALAEGVETYEELQVMIQLGSDLIQGFYVSKPKPIMLYEVSDSIKRDIEAINLINSSGDLLRPYHPAEGETVDLCLIRGDRYNCVCVEEDNVTLKGRSDIYLDMAITIRDGLECKLTLDNVRLKSGKDSPLIALGSASDVELIVTGKNELNGRGIFVPHDAALLIVGDDDGTLNINVDCEDGYAIGAGTNDSAGKITVDLRGRLRIKANGRSVTGIGGGNAGGAPIRLLGGEIDLNLVGRSCLCVGAADGGSPVKIENCSINMEVNARDAVGIGSFRGSADISLKNCMLRQSLSGADLTGIGSHERGAGSVMLHGATVNGTYMGHAVNCIGSQGGSIDCSINRSNLTFYGEGSTVTGIGDMTGAGNVTLDQVCLDIELKAENALAYGSETGIVTCRCVDENLRVNS